LKKLTLDKLGRSAAGKKGRSAVGKRKVAGAKGSTAAERRPKTTKAARATVV
jgi:hypothetical protein